MGQPAEDDQAVAAAAPFVQPLGAEEERLPELDLRGRQLELGRHHADDFDLRVV